jgi:hypothetical protein
VPLLTAAPCSTCPAPCPRLGSRLDKLALLRANPSKGGDAELRDYREARSSPCPPGRQRTSNRWWPFRFETAVVLPTRELDRWH